MTASTTDPTYVLFSGGYFCSSGGHIQITTTAACSAAGNALYGLAATFTTSTVNDGQDYPVGCYGRYHDYANLNIATTSSKGCNDGWACLCERASSAGVSGDPHVKGAHGEEADFKGENNGIYNMLSARNISLNLMIQHDTFRTPYSLLDVHGSWVRATFHTVRTSRSGQLLHIDFRTSNPHHAIIAEGCIAPHCVGLAQGNKRRVLTEGAQPFVVENVKVSLHQNKLTVFNGQWTTSAKATEGRPHWHKERINVEIKPTYAVDYDPIAPHGLVGQTYDRDQLEINGRRDSYATLDNGQPTPSRKGAGGDVTTRAKAEGAIEGVLEDYRMVDEFATAFRFSRFDALAAPPRNVTALTGKIGRRHTHTHPGREIGARRE